MEATARDGNITFTGAVSLGHQRTEAMAVVAELPGVRSVRNDIEFLDSVKLADVARHVQDALDRCAVLSDSYVMVSADANLTEM